MANPRIGRAWQKSTDAAPSKTPTTPGNAVSGTARMEGLSGFAPESPSTGTSATGTETTGISNASPLPSSSASGISTSGSEPTVWNLSPQSFIDSGIEVTTVELDERQTRRLSEYAFGIGLSVPDTIRDICHFLRDCGFDVYSGNLRDGIDFYLENYYYAP